MRLPKAFQWQGTGKVYSLPWLKNRLEYSSDPKRISEYSKTPFTRSRFVMKMLTEFHLSRNSILVSGDNHAKWLKRISRAYLPKEEVVPRIAQEVIDGVFPIHHPEQGEQKIQVSDQLIRELYRTMLGNVLKVEVLKPLDDFISNTNFPHGTRPMVLEGLMYSVRLHSPLLRPIRFVLDRLFFKESLHMKRISTKLVQLVCDFTLPKPGSWFSTLTELKAEGKVTEAQFRGEITSMLVSSYSLGSALGYALLCLAARPQYQRKIRKDPAFARYFVMEVFRLYPPIRQFGYEQAAAKKGAKLSGTAGHEFMIAVFALHRNGEAWEKPHSFYPERFLERGAAAGLKYLPFGMGKRSCPGRRYSMSLIAQAIQYICSDECPITLGKRKKLPRGTSGRLISFAIEDTLTYSIK